MYRGLDCPHTTKQLSSDTIYTEVASDSTCKGLSPTRLPHLLPLSVCACTHTHTHTHTHFRHHLQIQVVIHTSHWLTIKQRFLQLPPWVWLICQSASQNSEKHCTYWIIVYYGLLWKAITHKEPDERDEYSKVREREWSFHALFKCHSSQISMCSLTGSLLGSVLLGFCEGFII